MKTVDGPSLQNANTKKQAVTFFLKYSFTSVELWHKTEQKIEWDILYNRNIS